jgi:hypothetical protein
MSRLEKVIFRYKRRYSAHPIYPEYFRKNPYFPSIVRLRLVALNCARLRSEQRTNGPPEPVDRPPTFSEPRLIACGEDIANHIALPRGCIPEVKQLIEAHHIKPVIRDEQFTCRPIDMKFSGQLRPVRQCFLRAVSQYSFVETS